MMNNDLNSYRSSRDNFKKKDEILLMTLTENQTILTPNQSSNLHQSDRLFENTVSRKRLQLMNEVGGITIPEEAGYGDGDLNVSTDEKSFRKKNNGRIFSAGTNSV